MKGVWQSSQFPLLDHTEPRPPPRITHVPIPLPSSFNTMEIPRPIVPDVSLLFDASSGFKSSHSVSSRQHNTSKIGPDKSQLDHKNSTPSFNNPSTLANFSEAYEHSARSLIQSPNGNSVLNRRTNDKQFEINNEGFDNMGSSRKSDSLDLHSIESQDKLSFLINMMKRQEDSMSKMESQIKDIVDFQNNFLSTIIKRGGSLHKEVQTDEDITCCKKSSNAILSRNSSVSSFQSSPGINHNTNSGNDSSSKIKALDDVRNCSAESKQITPTPLVSSNGSLRRNKQITVDDSKTIQSERPPSSESNRTHGKEQTEDNMLSAVFKDLKLASVQEQSLFSETSLQYFDIQDYNDDSIDSNNDIGPSVSAYGSASSDDESTPAVKPTVTFYRNVLGNVNRLLENDGNQPTTQSKRRPPVHGQNHPRKHSTLAQHYPAHHGHHGRRDSAESSSSNSGGSERREARFQRNDVQPPENESKQSDRVADVTKRYLENLGVQFTPAEKQIGDPNIPNGQGTSTSQANVMIQQNVYNSIYIPTLNCATVAPESLDSNSGLFHEMAHKYIPQNELQQYKDDARKPGGKSTETTMYGMTSNHLSFATKQYLQRYGLVNQVEDVLPVTPQERVGNPYTTRPRQMQYTKFFDEPAGQSSDRILDLTALKNQPKLM